MHESKTQSRILKRARQQPEDDHYYEIRDDIPGMQRVREGLFFGDLMDASDHEAYTEHGLDVVFNLCGIKPIAEYPDTVQLFDPDLVDGETCRYENFRSTVQQVLEALDNDQTVFVHCAAGNSRSVTVCASVFALLEHTDFEEGMERIQELRIVSPEPTLLGHGERVVTKLQE